MQKEIKELIDLKIQTLFDKPPKKKFDPIFTKVQNKLRSVLHTATIKHGHVLEAAYLNAVKLEKKNLKYGLNLNFAYQQKHIVNLKTKPHKGYLKVQNHMVNAC